MELTGRPVFVARENALGCGQPNAVLRIDENAVDMTEGEFLSAQRRAVNLDHPAITSADPNKTVFRFRDRSIVRNFNAACMPAMEFRTSRLHESDSTIIADPKPSSMVAQNSPNDIA